ncbi:triphosphoribosyl-dephospho-CoA synthase CitG [Weissella beninensis]|uniref:Probable 2-(5''-triphosphoribosyl)-3'-dephosphocoenzyme-A synthase n=1 Tax=Periweissella beninensis TaxID=504936 RepID=A0ABT0VFK3_9LACO|nr:triphosphoribosyl-dephospho-CoA synthase CitG [Periweissella beninensis]MBM7543628.1 triphosphoribosyl-dephospho-CoA synthase CitG [Periweissella beninensis]MCM2436608.1 triphosphoribosyl-dephospho-CoA synthase CitG [Periweissella beninensis]
MKSKIIVEYAQKALLYEVSVNPKPGLVDPISNGAHQDMDVFTFINSSVSLYSYFEAASDLGLTFKGNENDLPKLFQTLRKQGQLAESTMFTATNGVNTHKGAIFSLGILVCATAYVSQHARTINITNIIDVVKRMLANLVNDDLANLKPNKPLTAGQQQYLKYGKTGIRGEAQAGFPTVLQFGLPMLRKSSGTINQRLLDTLMKIAQNTQDSNLIKRAHTPSITVWFSSKCQRYFELGGSKTAMGYQYLQSLDKILIAKNLSLGGSADLLILTIYLGLVEDIL